MGLQKYRADIKGETQSNGAIPYYTNWIGGPSLALIKNCPIKNTTIDTGISARTVYVRGGLIHGLVSLPHAPIRVRLFGDILL